MPGRGGVLGVRCVVLTRGPERVAWFSRVTGVAFAASFMALGSGQGGAAAILAFTAAVILAWAWLSLVSVKLYRRA